MQNFGDYPHGDITQIASRDIPNADVIVAGFPCQPFSLAGVSVKKSLGRAHGFKDERNGHLFFELVRVIRDKRPKAFFLENVKNLKYHDNGNTFKMIETSLVSLGYTFSAAVINAKDFVPQNRVRLYMVGLRKDLFGPDAQFEFPEIPTRSHALKDILEEKVDDKYTLSDTMWTYLQAHAEKHRRRGNGFGYALADPRGISRTLSARYYKDGAEILIPQEEKNPRKLTPRECARLMGFSDTFRIVVSNSQAYRQFGNSIVIPVIQ